MSIDVAAVLLGMCGEVLVGRARLHLVLRLRLAIFILAGGMRWHAKAAEPAASGGLCLLQVAVFIAGAGVASLRGCQEAVLGDLTLVADIC